MAKRFRIATGMLLAVLLPGCGSTLQNQATSVPGAPTTSSADGLGLGPAPSSAPVDTGSGDGIGETPTFVNGSGPSGPGNTTTTPGGTTIPTTPTGGHSSAAAGAIPLTGRGWDAKHVYVGVPTADDFNAAIKNLGATFDNGSTEGDVNAILADINKSGGIFGRKLVAVYHDLNTVQVASNPTTGAQATCTDFTQDRKVMAVINGVPQFDAIPAFHQCLERFGVPLLSASNTDYDDHDYERLGPHLWSLLSLSTDVLVPSLITSLSRQHFFTGWDAHAGRPGSAPVKAGLFLPDTAQGHHAAAVFSSSLRGASVPLAATFFYNATGSSSQSTSAVLRFQTAGVTHVLELPPVAADVLYFQEAADRQQYRPRYGLTSFNLPLSIEENPTLAPPDQQAGSMGIGWQPFNDVDAKHDPGPAPGSKRCLSVLHKGGQTFGSTRRRAALIGVALCDAMYLLRDAAIAGGGLTGQAFLAGMPLAGPRLATSATFRSVLSTTNHGLPGYYRDLQYRTSCKCYVYVGGNHLFTR